MLKGQCIKNVRVNRIWNQCWGGTYIQCGNKVKGNIFAGIFSVPAAQSVIHINGVGIKKAYGI